MRQQMFQKRIHSLDVLYEAIEEEGKYYSIKEPEKQRELEEKLCLSFKNLIISLNELDVFTMDDYIVFVKITGELALFIVIADNDNECLIHNFFKIFEYTLSNLLQDNYSKVIGNLR